MHFQRLTLCFIYLYSLLFATVSWAQSGELSADEANVESVSNSAELFGLRINDLSKEQLEAQLSAMGLQSFPSYKNDVVSYSLGTEGILGIKILSVYFNQSDYFRQAIMAGVVEDNEKRRLLGSLLVKKYGEPDVGYVNDGYGRAKWLFDEGNYIELHNTTFDVSVSYVDERPKVESRSGSIDVHALSRQSR